MPRTRLVRVFPEEHAYIQRCTKTRKDLGGGYSTTTALVVREMVKAHKESRKKGAR